MNRLFATGTALLALILQARSVALAQAQAPQAVVQSETRVVAVNAIAKDKHGKPIEDLKPGDFALRDNDRPQRIDSFAPENVSLTGGAAASQPMTLTDRAPVQFPVVVGKTSSSLPFA